MERPRCPSCGNHALFSLIFEHWYCEVSYCLNQGVIRLALPEELAYWRLGGFYPWEPPIDG